MANSFALLLRQNFGDLEEAASSWRKLGESAGEAQQRHRSQASGPLGNWSGAAAEAARPEIDKAEQRLGIVNAEAMAIAVTIDTVFQRMSAAQQELRSAVAEAEGNNYRVGDDGSVTGPQLDPAYRNDPDYQEINRQQNARLGEFRQRIEDAVRKAEQASADGAASLSGLNGDILEADLNKAQAEVANDVSGMRSSLGLASVVPNHDNPADNAKWWNSLTDRQQREYLALYPGEVGNRNGIPSDKRDVANRAFLEQQLDLARTDGSEDGRKRLGALQKLKDRLDKEDRDPNGPEVYVIGLDPKDDGQAIVAFGNPDTAKNTAVYVPGTTADLDSMGGDLDRMKRLQQAAGQYGDPGETATVMWLGYDAPDSVWKDAPFDNYAEAGAPRLDRYIDSLGTTHDGGPRHTSVVGHSYGSVVIGDAARNGNGLAVDEIVVAGSPGMHVQHAKDLNIDPKHVWAAEADWDPVPAAGVAKHGRGGWWDLPNHPTSDDFGANRITTEGNSGHSEYWNDNKVESGRPHNALDNQAAIITGQYGSVDLEHGTRP
ncbi:alpha/beta hydrolase [Kitasatospora sp. NPDC051853]|uniref:alpha/beta hydrolase n=1 Tax=Kitasatospora sp. NPDC051853 TaxID=3364058 RepID=UPI0037ACEB4E